MAALQSPPASPPGLETSLQHQQLASTPHAAIPYSASFSNSLMRAVLNPPSASTGITVIPEASADTAVPQSSIRLSDIDLSSLPSIPPTELPLLIDDSRRVYKSALSGINLTHPGGWLEGGAGPTLLHQTQDPPSADAEAYLVRHSIRTQQQLREQVHKDIQAQIAVLKDRMREREEAVRENEEVERKVEALVEQRKLERKIEERMRKEILERREEEG